MQKVSQLSYLKLDGLVQEIQLEVLFLHLKTPPRYFNDFVSWARKNNAQYFYFEAFDETWKATNEGPQGAHWGIWDKDGNMKTGMETIFLKSTKATGFEIACGVICLAGIFLYPLQIRGRVSNPENMQQFCHTVPKLYASSENVF